jgi:predicted glutamine amidotransferase
MTYAGSCHPFSYGRYIFMHNGNVGAFQAVRRKLLATLRPDLFDYAAERVRTTGWNSGLVGLDYIAQC